MESVLSSLGTEIPDYKSLLRNTLERLMGATEVLEMNSGLTPEEYQRLIADGSLREPGEPTEEDAWDGGRLE